ncbi:hypothetical protein LTR70_008053 [Exophiala xenobiotica]|uniref:AB hydrolase-1 domain-containing protein n=1 Tax=Lithohypha guttulata TaxID=1690604 RepID=A0ABR0K3H6_9EURO|nr:hypothetical protein LTR24_007571 [Lithohypha guttulata]KAK5312683.1 hypothetical protein LTR70_008053 [Exophiala xenobiotica]
MPVWLGNLLLYLGRKINASANLVASSTTYREDASNTKLINSWATTTHRRGLSAHTISPRATLFCTGFAFRSILAQQPKDTIRPSPRKTLLPNLTEAERLNLPYPPDALPGARDVDSPYGTFRVYEFGPEDGRKVLLVHGISTPCLALGGVAHTLAEKGCRVMLFDLPGRGYSDTPSDLDHDIRLFTSQILIVLASSSLPWTSPQGFSIVGYSLGGGISAAFTAYFPDLIQSLVLIAPAGLIRDKHISRTSRILYAKTTLLEPMLLRIVRSRLRKPLYPPKHSDSEDQGQPSPSQHHGAKDAVQAEVSVPIESNSTAPIVLSRSHPNITIEAAVNHQIENHVGFVPAFMSSIRYGPIQRQHERWRRVGRTFRDRNQDVLVILGERDPIIKVQETREDATECFGGRVRFVVMDAGHEAPVSKGPEAAERIWEFWEGQEQRQK